MNTEKTLIFLRTWNLLYSRSFSYSPDHPIVESSIAPTAQSLFELIQEQPSLSILFQEHGFFIENQEFPYQANNKRIGEHLKAIGIQSITIPQNTTILQIQYLLRSCIEPHNSSESFIESLKAKGAVSIKINAASLHLLEDEFHSPASAKDDINNHEDSEQILKSLLLQTIQGKAVENEFLFNSSLMYLLQNPEQFAGQVINISRENPEIDTAKVLQQSLSPFLKAFESEQKQHNKPPEQMLSELYDMRIKIVQAMNSQQQLNETLTEEQSAPVDALFHETGTNIIVEEYKKSPQNLQRLAQIIHRVVPEKNALRSLLAMLRKKLMDSGMSVVDYYRLLQELEKFLSSEESVSEFFEISENFGLSSENILNQLKKDPESLAQMFLYWHEYQKNSNQNSKKPSSSNINNTLESVSNTSLTEINSDPSKLKLMIEKWDAIENKMTESLKLKEGASFEDNLFLEKLNHQISHAKSKMKGTAFLSHLNNPSNSENETIEFILNFVRSEDDLTAIFKSLESSQKQQQFPLKAIQKIKDKLQAAMKAKRQRFIAKNLPENVYVKNVFDFTLMAEISRSQRYSFPFSTVLITFEGLPQIDNISENEIGHYLEIERQILQDLRRLIRKSDFLGYINFNRYLILLPMAEYDHAIMVAKKLKSTFSKQIEIEPQNYLQIAPKIGIATFEKNKCDTYSKLFEEMQRTLINTSI